MIYKYGLDHIPKHKADDLYMKYTAFEKQHGNKGSIDLVILSKRRFQFEEVRLVFAIYHFLNLC